MRNLLWIRKYVVRNWIKCPLNCGRILSRIVNNINNYAKFVDLSFNYGNCLRANFNTDFKLLEKELDCFL